MSIASTARLPWVAIPPNYVPYGIPEHWFDLQPNPHCGRVLFVVKVGLREESHVLAEACRILKARGVAYECRVAGPRQADDTHPLFEGPTCLGQVPGSQVQEKFRCADFFVLPTLADSFGLVHLEAMACGVPVITTPNCGSVVRDGVDGFMVPIRDASALTDRMQQIVQNRLLRRQMGSAARQLALECFGDRLLSALRGA